METWKNFSLRIFFIQILPYLKGLKTAVDRQAKSEYLEVFLRQMVSIQLPHRTNVPP